MKADPLVTYSDMKFLPFSQQKLISGMELRHSLNQVAKSLYLVKYWLGWLKKALLFRVQMYAIWILKSCLFRCRELLQKVHRALFVPPFGDIHNNRNQR